MKFSFLSNEWSNKDDILIFDTSIDKSVTMLVLIYEPQKGHKSRPRSV